MKRTITKQRVGVRVHVGELHFDYPTSNGWGIDSNGVLGIGTPSNRQDVNGNSLNDTIAAFKTWDRVSWKTI